MVEYLTTKHDNNIKELKLKLDTLRDGFLQLNHNDSNEHIRGEIEEVMVSINELEDRIQAIEEEVKRRINEGINNNTKTLTNVIKQQEEHIYNCINLLYATTDSETFKQYFPTLKPNNTIL